VRLDPVVDDPAVVASVVARSTGASVTPVAELDVDVHRLRGPGSDLVVRVFGPEVSRTTLDAAVSVLGALAGTPFPAERCAPGDPVLTLGDGVHLLVTEYVEPSPAPRPGFLLAWCAALLGRLATRPADGLPPGGGWHRLGATPSLEVDAALRLGEQLGPPVAELLDALADADDGTGLPRALVHADLTPANAVPQGEDRPAIIDWIGVGDGPRAWPLAPLLLIAGPRGCGRTLERYGRSVTLTDEERRRLPGLMATRPLTLDLWSVAYGRMDAATAVERHRARQARIRAVGAELDAPQAGGAS
jgi:Ser/Thr protein kinase RdoA (MazF antagonist)